MAGGALQPVLAEASRSELERSVETQLPMSESGGAQSPIHIFNLIIWSLLSAHFLGCLFVFFTLVYIN